MNLYRLVAMGVLAGAAGLSATACSAGITTAGRATSPSPEASRTVSSATASPANSPAASPSHTGSASAISGSTVSVDAPMGTFPIPHGAQVAANMPCGKQILLEIGAVTPTEASAFYATALPRAGYAISNNTLTSDPTTGAPHGMAEITFTGHHYTGLIIAMADPGADASPGASPIDLPSNLAKNAVEITLTPPGASECPG